MKYTITASSRSKNNASIHIKASEVVFGMTPESADVFPNPAELFLGAFAACVLKNVERFSVFMNFEYSNAEITVNATRLEKPPRMDNIAYVLKIYTHDPHLNSSLLKKNIENFGTIFNTMKASCTIIGEIEVIQE